MLEHGNPSLNVKHIGIPLRKYGVATYGQVWYTTHYNSEERQSYKSYSDARILIPDHFGYDHHEQIGELFTVPTYLILTKHDRLVYEEAWKPPIPTRWGKDDFAKLEADPSAYLEYGNGEFEVWRIWPVFPRSPEWAEMLYER